MTEIEQTLTSILNCSRTELYLERFSLDDKKLYQLFSTIYQRRALSRPLQYILGYTEFMGLNFKIKEGVFIPRPETEILVETAIKYVTKLQNHKVTKLNILDIGTGSGCIAVSLAKFIPLAKIIATDYSVKALEIAKDNAKLNKVSDKITFIRSDLFTSYKVRVTSYDIIVSNPPYIPAREIGLLQPEIRYEPRIALDGGEDGLEFYKRIFKESHSYLKENGYLIMEVGFGQAKTIKDIASSSVRFKVLETIKDYSDIERVIVFKIVN